ncbi:MAG: hypothetical protein ABIT83_03695 [Massilia sp.]
MIKLLIISCARNTKVRVSLNRMIIQSSVTILIISVLTVIAPWILLVAFAAPRAVCRGH